MEELLVEIEPNILLIMGKPSAGGKDPDLLSVIKILVKHYISEDY